jgi:hypothetical protein
VRSEAAAVPAEAAWLRLYVARGTPNSARAEQNLSAAMAGRDDLRPYLEIINVFIEARRALQDGVTVTPTLIACKGGQRQMLIGDLTETNRLELVLAIFGTGTLSHDP